MPEAPSRGFSLSEFERRTQRVQELMTDLQIDALFLCSEPEVRYFSGFQSQFWESPTRPWFLIVPLEGCPIAVIPEIGASAMEATWIDDIRTWPAPQPDDDGISLLKQVFAELPRRHGRVGAPLGHETLMRMPIADFQKLQGSVEFVDATSVLRTLRNVKSSGEIAKIRYICQVASDAFEALPQSLKTGQSEKDNCRRMAVDLLQRGADSVPYLIAGSGPGGYDSIMLCPINFSH